MAVEHIGGFAVRLHVVAEAAPEDAIGSEGLEGAADKGLGVGVRVLLLGRVADAGVFEVDTRVIGELENLVEVGGLAHAGAAHVVEDNGGVSELGGEFADGGGVVGKEVHLNDEAKRCGGGPGVAELRRGEVAVLDRAGGERSFAGRVHGVDAEPDNAAREFLDEGAHALWGAGIGGVVEAGAFEQAGRFFVLEAVFKIRVVVLVGFRVNDDGMVDGGLCGEGEILGERGGFGLVGAVGMVGEFGGFKQVDVSIDGKSAWLREKRSGQEGKSVAASEHGKRIHFLT